MARRKKDPSAQELYTDEQRRLIEKHITEHFGMVSNYYQNTDESSIKLDINVIPASRKKPYVTLVTTGMGAHVMRARGKRGNVSERAELVLYLPPYMAPAADDNGNLFWPVRLIDLVANFAAEENVWLGIGHTINYGRNFEERSGFRGVILLMADAGEDAWNCQFSDGEKVTFYQLVPLFDSEMRYAVKVGPIALARRLGDLKKAADSDRNPCVPDNFEDILDNVADHSCKIEKNELELPEINGANHIASFLRWMIFHGMINDEFLEHFEDEFSQIRAGELDVRTFLMRCLDGELNKELFTDEGMDFSGYYYDFYGGDDYPCYPSDVDSMALNFFGEERYNCEEFCDEAYLFVPYNEDYYARMAAYIDKAYEGFKGAMRN